MREVGNGDVQALEACVADAAGFLAIFRAVTAHPQGGLLVQGLMAPASMYVLESSRCFAHIEPSFEEALDELNLELMREARHRAKLLDFRAVTDVTAELLRIGAEQYDSFNRDHRGLLGPLKRALQKDMGIGLCDGHLIQSTHATIFGFGTSDLDGAKASAFGHEVGAYTGSILDGFGIDREAITGHLPDLGTLEMRDIRYEQLYERGGLGALGREVGAGAALVLCSVNLGRLVVARALPRDDLTRLRTLFVVAFHAMKSLKSLQDGVIARQQDCDAARSILADAIGSRDARWLRKHRHLRNLLVHYLPDNTMGLRVDSPRRIDWIEEYAEVSFDDLVQLVDRYLEHVSGVLEEGLGILGDRFEWASVA